jgi:tetratricopeptide (TPR) repeat protein
MNSLEFFYLIHALISLIISIVASHFLLHKFQTKRFDYILFFWVLNIALPIIGYFMTVWIVYYLLNVVYEKQLHNVHFINMIEFENEFPKINRIFGESAMDKLLSSDNHVNSSSLKMKALVSLADNASKGDLSLIKNRLSDKNDEVRLYSFAVIDKLQRGINGQIHDKMKLFEEAEDNRSRTKKAEELAYLYWDLVYFELTDSDLKKFIIEEVKKYALIALESNPNNEKINVLLGKTYLAQKEVDKAQQYFTKAINHGINMDFIVPYLAEIFFIKKDYAKVKKLLGSTKSLHANAVLHPLVVQWE